MLLKCWVFLCLALHDVFRNAWCYWGHERKALESCLTVWLYNCLKEVFLQSCCCCYSQYFGAWLISSRSPLDPILRLRWFNICASSVLNAALQHQHTMFSFFQSEDLGACSQFEASRKRSQHDAPARAVASSQSSHSANRPPRRTSRTGRPNTSTSTRRFTKTPVSYVIP